MSTEDKDKDKDKDKGKLKPEEKEELLTDLDAFAPDQPGSAKRSVKFKGKKYPIVNFMDLEYEQIIELLQLDEVLKDKGVSDQMSIAIRQVEILIPNMPEEMRNKLTGRMIVKIATEAFGVSSPPQEGSERD